MTRRPVSACIFGGILLAALIGGMVASRNLPGGPLAWTENAMNAASSLGPLGAFIFICALVLIAFSGVLPASLIGMAAGALYGTPKGFALSAASVMAGAWLSFVASRHLFRQQVERMLADKPKLHSMDTRLAGEGWRLVCLLRVSPVMPFALTSYMLGLSSVSQRDYFIGTSAALPALLGYVILGRLAREGLHSGASGAGILHWSMLGVGILATVALTVVVGKIMARAGMVEGQ